MLKIDERQIFYLILILGAGFFLHMAHSIPTSMGVGGDPGPGSVPFWVSLIIIFLVGYLLVMETVFDRPSGDLVNLSRSEAIALIITLSLIVLYLTMLMLVGFFLSTVFFLFLFRTVVDLFVPGSDISLITLAKSVVFAVSATSLIYTVFSVIFELALP